MDQSTNKVRDNGQDNNWDRPLSVAPTVPSSVDDYDTSDPEVIQRRIEQTRANMSETINEIQTRLSPERLKREAQETIRDATIGKVEDMANTLTYKARNWRYSAIETIKQNPVPAALIGIGLGWLLLEGNSRNSEWDDDYRPAGHRTHLRSSDYYKEEDGSIEQVKAKAAGTVRNLQEKAHEVSTDLSAEAQNAVQTVQEGAADVVESVRESATHIADQAHDVADQVRDQARVMQYKAWRQGERAQRSAQRTFEANPLAVGAVAIAIGTAVGLALPSTQKEDEWMGDTRDRLVDQAKVKARETAEKVRDVAIEMQEAALETAKEENDKKGLPTPQ